MHSFDRKRRDGILVMQKFRPMCYPLVCEWFGVLVLEHARVAGVREAARIAKPERPGNVPVTCSRACVPRVMSSVPSFPVLDLESYVMQLLKVKRK